MTCVNSRQYALITRYRAGSDLENLNPGEDDGTVDENVDVLDIFAVIEDLPQDFEGFEAEVEHGDDAEDAGNAGEEAESSWE